MGRKYELTKESKKLIANPKRGSFRTRKEHQREMNRFFEDCAHLKQLPNGIKRLTPQHIERLVEYWKKRKLSDNTIITKLTVLRRLNRIQRLGLNIPTNLELSLKKSTTQSITLNLPDNYADNIYHPVTKCLIGLQCQFGLTPLEATKFYKFTPHTARKSLSINRNISHNHQDRYIPVLTDAQQNCLSECQKLSQHSPFFQSEKAEEYILNLYRAECRHADIADKTEFRKIYGEKRLSDLMQTLSEGEAWTTLCQEMGYKRSDTLKKRLG